MNNTEFGEMRFLKKCLEDAIKNSSNLLKIVKDSEDKEKYFKPGAEEYFLGQIKAFKHAIRLIDESIRIYKTGGIDG